MTRKFGPSQKASTGHTSTQSVYLQRMQASVTTKVMVDQPQQAPPEQHESTAAELGLAPRLPTRTRRTRARSRRRAKRMFLFSGTDVALTVL
jgi:hypothetical protein